MGDLLPSSLTESRAGRALLVGGGLVIAFFLAGSLLPNGMPLGIVLYGLVLGSLTGLTAMGLVLIYRSSRIINFAQVEIGGLAATVAIVMVTGWHVPYFVALPIGLATAIATGALIDLVVIKRFFTAPRLILTVATIGLLQILGAAEIELPRQFVHLRNPLQTFKTPFQFTFRLGPILFNGDHVVALIVVPIVLVGLGWFLRASDTGIAVRGAADSNERALLLGIPVRRLSLITWMVAAGLSGIAAMLTAPILGPSLGVVGGPVLLLPPLAAAVVARFDSLPRALGASLAIGVFQQAVFWSYPRSSTVDVALFVLILAALLLQRRQLTRVDSDDIGGYVAVREVRPIPALLRRRWEVVAGKSLIGVGAVALALFLPLVLSHANVILVTYMALFGIIAVSLVLLTGWAGQISLGQFAFVGIGASVTASLLVHAGADLFVALILSGLAGAVAAVIIGIPALRIQGLFLAVTTLAFAVPVSTYLLNSAYFPTLNPHQLNRPVLLKRFDLDKPLTFYYVCLAALVLAVLVARNFRRSRAGRAVLAVRDNEWGAAAYAVNATRVRLTAFALSGAMAGFAGGLFAVAQRKIGFGGFDPVLSVTVFTMVVVGGLGSIPGALLGAIYVESAQNFLHDPARLLATGAGLLILLMVAPGGLGEIMYALRDRALRALARARGLSVPSLAEHPTFEAEPTPVGAAIEPVPGSDTRELVPGRLDLIRCEDVDAGYGQIQVLFDVDLAVGDGEIVALLGTNGAGKSTALRVISGLLPPTRGRVFFNDTDVTRLGPIGRVRAGIVTVPGGRGVFPSLTVAENLRLAGWLTRSDPDFLEAATRRVFELFPVLNERLNTRASALSGGEQQMLTLAQALLCRPRLLMIDELSLGLAPAVVAMLLDVVRQFNDDGITIILVEQSVNVAAALASRAVFMEKGQVRFTGPTDELVGRDDLLRSVFLRHGSPARTRRRVAAPANGRDGEATATDEPHVLEAISVSKRFGGVTAVDQVDFTVKPGQILGIIGSNGAGKTTLFDVCSGFLAPDAGRLALTGRDVTELGASDRAELGLGRSFQDARLFPSMTVSETLATALERHVGVRDPLACALRVGAVVDSEAAVTRRVEELIELTGLQRYRDAFVSELSTGTRRIVELTCAMAHDPLVLLLDEPSSGIAQRESEALAELLLELKDRTNTSLAVIEHDIPLVSSIADHLICLHLGRVIASGRPEVVLKDDAVVASYLGSDPEAIARSGSAAAVLQVTTGRGSRRSSASKGNGRSPRAQTRTSRRAGAR